MIAEKVIRRDPVMQLDKSRIAALTHGEIMPESISDEIWQEYEEEISEYQGGVVSDWQARIEWSLLNKGATPRTSFLLAYLKDQWKF